MKPGSSAEAGIVVESDFRPAWWCAGPHPQTMWPYLFRRGPTPAYRRRRLELPDRDFLDLDWYGPADPELLVVLLHGLEGSSSSHYIRALSRILADHDVASVVMHQRGCGGEPNRLPRFYHAGETDDLRFVLETIHETCRPSRLCAVGFSLGGNILLKWLGQSGHGSLISAAAVVSVPFRLDAGARRLDHGLSRLYRDHLIRSMKRSVETKRQRMSYPVGRAELSRCRTFEQIDTCLTAPLHGFRDAHDYYSRNSSRQFLGTVRTPTLIVHARDDPFMSPWAIPGADELSPVIRLELSRSGGHCGFVAGNLPFQPRYWLDHRIPEFLLGKAGWNLPATG